MTDFYALQYNARVMIANLLRDAAPAPAAPAAPGRLVKITGTAQPGPEGLLRAPLSGTPCVWWQTIRADERISLLLAGNTFGPVGGTLPNLPSSMFATSVPLPGGTSGVAASFAPFAVSDATGEVLIRPQGACMDSTVQSSNYFDRRETRIYQLDGVAMAEWIIPAGQPVLAIGVATPEPGLVAPNGAALVVTTRPEPQLAADIQAFLRPGRTPADVQRRIHLLVFLIVGVSLAVAAIVTVLALKR